MKTMPEIAWIMAPTTSLSSATWPSISFARSRQRAPCASRSSGPDGRTHISPKSSLKSEMRLPCALDQHLDRGVGPGDGGEHLPAAVRRLNVAKTDFEMPLVL